MKGRDGQDPEEGVRSDSGWGEVGGVKGKGTKG